MSTSNNLDERLVLHYITRTLHNWGLTYLTEQTFKAAKKNDPSYLKQTIRMLFDLVCLHIFDYEYTIQELSIQFQEEGEMLEIIMAHLFELDCGILVVTEYENMEESLIGYDFSSSRHLLLTCGWLMSVSDFFSKNINKLIKKKINNIYQPPPLNLNALAKKYALNANSLNLHEDSLQIQRVSYLAKILKNRKYSVECLLAKRNKLIKRIRGELKEVSSQLTIEEVFGSQNSEQVDRLETELREIILFEKENMIYRKYWWSWLDSKIIAAQEKDLKNEFEKYHRLQLSPEQHKQSIEIDLDYPKKYLEMCDHCQEQIETITQQINSIGLSKGKKYKDIDRELFEEVKKASERGRLDQQAYPSFIGMQLKRYMGIGQQVKITDPKHQRQLLKNSSKQLKENIRSFLSQLEQIILL